MIHLISVVCFLMISSISRAEIAPQKFKQLMVEHKMRVVALGQVFNAFPFMYPDLNSKLVESYLRLHDLPKLMELEELALYGYRGKEPIYVILARYYGVRMTDLPPEDQAILRKAISELNRIENMMKAVFLSLEMVAPHVAKQLKHFDHVVDVSDTGLTRAEELDFAETPYYGASWLTAEGDLIGAKVSRYIENNFEDLLESPYLVGLRCRMYLTPLAPLVQSIQEAFGRVAH